ncbi:MAG: DNA recombination protein RmuC [Chloroflexi bacterium]|nr:DNA recombination protein RmuC [Chloroflexota bacterium]
METVIGLVAGAIVVGLAAWLVQEFRWRQRNAELRGQLTRAVDAEQLMQATEQRMGTAFQAAAAPVMKQSMEQFLVSATNSFSQSRKSFEELVKPLRENYEKLNPNIESLMRQNISIAEATRGLRDALSDNRQVGAWGEIQLRRIIELANMVDYCDFSEQTTVDDGSGRPDVTVRLPENRAIVIDSKASAAAYLEAQEAETDDEAEEALVRHAGALRSKVDDLARKDYGKQVAGSLDFVVMFVPGDQFLAEALRARNDLIEYAMSRRIAIATPSTLISLLWAVANGWERHSLEQNAEEIRKAGEEMHGRLLTFMNHYSRAGNQLRQAVDSFNASVGSFDTRVIPQAQRFAQLRGQDPEVFSGPPQIEAEPRESRYTSAAVTAGADENETP